MARLRKAGRILRNPDAVAAAARAMVKCEKDYFAIEPRVLFTRQAPIELELGAGRGDFIIERARLMPQRNFLAVELAGVVVQLLATRAGRAGIENLRVARVDARTMVNLLLGDQSVAACHIYFPDPWPKEAQAKHRLFTPRLVTNLGRILEPGAPLYIATDVADYADIIFAMLDAGGFRRIDAEVPGASKSGFAHKFIAQGRPIYAGAFMLRIAESVIQTA
jgi:tRNA (guanine-N7-)-methyltransferase